VEPTGSRLSRRKNRFRAQRPAADTGKATVSQELMQFHSVSQIQNWDSVIFLPPGSGSMIWDREKIRIRDKHPGYYFRILGNNSWG
jgi:hypothetical protein